MIINPFDACPCCDLHNLVVLADAAVAKKLAVSELAQMARSEERLRSLLLNRWRGFAERASTAAGKAFGSGVVAARKAIDVEMRKFPKDVEKSVRREIQETYTQARNGGFRKATKQTKASLQYTVPNFSGELGGEASVEKALQLIEKAKPRKKPRTAATLPSLDLEDGRAIADLGDDTMVWIGRHYEENVRETVREAVKPGVAEGLGRVEAGKQVADVVRSQLDKVTVPGGFNGTAAKYFEGLAANTSTNSRVRGQIRSFVDAEIETYVLTNPNDNRTSPICRHVDGKRFTIGAGTTQIERQMSAQSPADLRALHPWLPLAEILKISPVAGHVSAADSRALASRGLALPPFHFRCRTTVDVWFG